MSEGRRILVTGGSGFIGTNVVQHYLDQGATVLSLDIAEPKNPGHHEFFKKVDLLDKEELTASVKDFSPTHVIHLAARTDLDEKHDIGGYAANTDGVRNLIEATLACPNLERVIFSSSMLVCRFGYVPKDLTDYNPNTLYGESKVLTEKIIKNRKLPYVWTIVRPTSIWGPWFGVPYKLFFDIVTSGRFVHPGNRAGSAVYGFIGNTLYQIDRVLTVEDRLVDGKTFYLGDSPPNNLSEWADEIAEAAGRKNLKLPYAVVRSAAVFGDLLALVGIRFPITSFRLRNMTTDNIPDLKDMNAIAPLPPFTRKEGIVKTLAWIKSS